MQSYLGKWIWNGTSFGVRVHDVAPQQFNDCPEKLPRKLHVIFLDVSKLALDIMKQMMYQSYSDDVPSPSKKGKLSWRFRIKKM